jgi:MFS family permease
LLEADAPIIFLLFNATYSLSSFPVGILSDRMSRYHLLALGFAILIISDLILAMATNLTTVFVGIALWGLQMGIHQSMFYALVADNSPDDLRGTAFSVYYLITAAAILVGEVLLPNSMDQAQHIFLRLLLPPSHYSFWLLLCQKRDQRHIKLLLNVFP